MRTVLLGVCVLSGCVTSTAVRVGPQQPRKPPCCVIRIATDAPEELMDEYQRVGSVCITETSGFGAPEAVTSAIKHPGAERDELFGRACALGGDVVAVWGVCNIGRANAVEFAVLRTRPQE
jgi:hypothetical protein